MTTDVMLKTIVEQGEKMRILQQRFFKEGKNMYGDAKKNLLNESKQAEKEFDNILFNAKQLIK